MALKGYVHNYVTYSNPKAVPHYLINSSNRVSSNGTWMKEGEYSFRGGGGLDNLSNVYQVFNCNWTSYCNKFNNGAYVDICLPSAIKLSGFSLGSSSTSCFPSNGEIQYSDDGKTYVYCTSWHNTNEVRIPSNVDAHRIWRIQSSSNSSLEILDNKVINFDGNKDYASVPVALTDKTNWSIEIELATKENRSNSRIYRQPCIVGVDTSGVLSRDFHIDVKNGNLHLFSGLGGTNDASQLNSGTLSFDSNDCGWDTGIKINDGALHKINLTCKDNKLTLILDDNELGYLNIDRTVKGNVLYLGASYPSEKCFCQFDLYKLYVSVDGNAGRYYKPSDMQILSSSNMNIAKVQLYYYESIDYTLPEGLGGWLKSLASYRPHGPLLSKQLIPYFTYKKYRETRKIRVSPRMSANGTWMTENSYSAQGGGGLSNLSDVYRVFNGGWTSYCNKFNAGTYIEICLAKPIAIREIYLSSSDGYLPARGEIYYSDDGIYYDKCADWIDTSNSKNCTSRFDDIGAHKIWRITSDARATAYPSSNADISQALLYYYEEVVIDPWEGIDRPMITGWAKPYATYQSHGPLISKQIIPYFTYSKTQELRINWEKPYLSIDNGIWWEDGKWSFRASDGVKQPENLYKVFQGWHSGNENCIYANNIDEWFEVCLPKPLKVVSIYLQSHNGYLPRGVKIAYSDDGENYTEIANWDNPVSRNSEGIVNIPNPETHRMWRIITTANTNPVTADANVSKAIIYHEELVKINPWEGRDVFIAGFTEVYATARPHAGLQSNQIIPYVLLRKHDVLDDVKPVKIKLCGFMHSLADTLYVGKVRSSDIGAILHPDVRTK